MAQFGIEATKLSDPNLAAASFIRPAVQDSSAEIGIRATTEVIKPVGEQALGAYVASQKAEANKITQEEIRKYMNPDETAAQDTSTSLFKSGGEQLSAVEKAQKEKLAAYQRALAQGAISPDEFADRVTSNLRELTNKNPGLFGEFKAEAARVMELSGITGIIKSDKLITESISKREENLLKDMQERAKKENIYYDVTTPYWALADSVQKAESDTRSYNLQVRNKERFSMASQEQSRQWVEESGDSVVRGSLANTQKLIVDMADTQGINSQTYPKFRAQVEASIDNMHGLFVDSIPVNIRQEPIVQEKIRAHEEGMKRLKERLSGLTSGEDMKKVLSNEVEILKAHQDKTLRQTVDVAALDMSIKLIGANPGIITHSEEGRQRLVNASIAISSGNFTSPALKNILPKSDRDTSSASMIVGAVNLGKQSGDYTGFNNTMEALNSQTQSIENPKTRLQYLFNNVSAISKSTDMKLDAVGLQHVETTIDQFLKDPQFGLGTIVDTSKGKVVSLTATSEGNIMFVGPDATQFNKVYANNINLATQAYASSHGISNKEAAKIIIPRYLGDIVKALKGGPTSKAISPQERVGVISRGE